MTVVILDHRGYLGFPDEVFRTHIDHIAPSLIKKRIDGLRSVHERFCVLTSHPFPCWELLENEPLLMYDDQGNLAEVKNEIRMKVVYGSVLDAYESGLFGDGLVRGKGGMAKQKRYYHLNLLRRFGKSMSEDEMKEIDVLSKIFHCDDN